MLDKSRLTKFLHGDEQWHTAHLGVFSSSQIYKLCGEDGIGKTGMSYIRTRVFESLSGQSGSPEFLTEATAEGNANEMHALREWSNKEGGVSFMLVQKMIYGDDPLFVSTPDALMLTGDHGDKFNAATFETKCFQAEKHMEAIECITPQDIKKFSKPIYWQVLDQLLTVDTISGYLIFFHPSLPRDNGGLHTISFNKAQRLEIKGKFEFPISKDIAFLRDRKNEAKKLFNEIKNKLLNVS